MPGGAALHAPGDEILQQGGAGDALVLLEDMCGGVVSTRGTAASGIFSCCRSVTGPCIPYLRT